MKKLEGNDLRRLIECSGTPVLWQVVYAMAAVIILGGFSLGLLSKRSLFAFYPNVDSILEYPALIGQCVPKGPLPLETE